MFAACGGAPSSQSTGDGGDIIESADGAVPHGDASSGNDDSGGGGASDSGIGGGDSGGGAHDASGGGSDSGSDSGTVAQDSGATDSGGGGGGPITCPGPGNYTKNGGACGSERWNIKTGTDNGATSISLVPKTNTIAALGALPANGGGTSRSSPNETTLWELRDVTLTMIKLESDSDYHLVVSDGTHSMIVEVPYPTCANGSAWSCFISRARAEVDAKLNVSTSPQYPALTVTVRGVGFFDNPHGQTGEAPNSFELHSVLQICFGKGCTPS